MQTHVLDQYLTERVALYNADCVPAVAALPPASVHFTLTSIPFSNLYTYSDSEADMGNTADDAEFFRHFGYLVPALLRVTVPGRLCAVHCKQLVDYASSSGRAGLRDFRGDVIRAMEAGGWKYHSEVCIWTDPVKEMQKTKANGLLYKTIRRDASFSRQGLAEYLCVFRKWPTGDLETSQQEPVRHTTDGFPLDTWQRYASPVWFDLDQTDVLNVRIARDSADEKHLCPFSLDLVRRALDLWTNPGDVVLDPFAGVCSVGFTAIEKGRRFIGCELKESYFRQGKKFLALAESRATAPRLFDLDTFSGGTVAPLTSYWREA